MAFQAGTVPLPPLSAVKFYGRRGPCARLVGLDVGHELNEMDWDRIVDEVRIQTA